MEFTKNTRGFEELQFVIKAASKDELRPNINFIHVTEEYLEATDGHRLHRSCETMGLLPGLYKVIKSTKKDVYMVPDESDLQYPDTERIWPKESPEPVELYPETYNSTPDATFSLALAQIVRLSEKHSVSVTYLKDILSSSGSWSVAWSGGYDALLFQNGTKAALLMPLKG